ncbi:MAG TPA: adenylate/guanylate cyclase domain-containing protein, partial [Thermoanaerobaculia bacterium]|nr:adenylate/guanylate cyclase domain-containing protein [Thermoanaerobaculia bacterium]
RRVDYTVLGNPVNVAARMEEFVAMPGDIVIGPATYEATRDLFEVAQLGFFALKGVSAQVPLYKLLGAREAPELQLAEGSKSRVKSPK